MYSGFYNYNCFCYSRICGPEIAELNETEVKPTWSKTKDANVLKYCTTSLSAAVFPSIQLFIVTCLFYIFGAGIFKMSSFRKALKSQQKNHHERSQVIVSVLCLLFYNSAYAEICIFATNIKNCFRLCQGIWSKRSTQNRIYMCNLCLCFCASRLAGRIWVCWRRRRTTNFVQSKIRYLFSVGFFCPQYLHPKIRKAAICACFVISQWLPQETKHSCCSPKESAGQEPRWVLL